MNPNLDTDRRTVRVAECRANGQSTRVGPNPDINVSASSSLAHHSIERGLGAIPEPSIQVRRGALTLPPLELGSDHLQGVRYVSMVMGLAQLIMKRRYDIRVDGLEAFPKGAQGFLIAPNHPSLLDPVLVSSVFGTRAPVRPLVTEAFYQNPLLKRFFRKMGAIPLPDLTVGDNFGKRRKIAQSIATVLAALRNGENVLMYPSGQLMRTEREDVRRARGLHTLLSHEPDLNVLLVQTQNLYGSRFSTAPTGRVPNIAGACARSFPKLLQTSLGLAVKRRVEIRISPMPDDVRAVKELVPFNQRLNEFFNRD